jgi:hypothetical protein
MSSTSLRRSARGRSSTGTGVAMVNLPHSIKRQTITAGDEARRLP